MAILHGHVGGVTHVRFSSDGHRLYSGARKVGTTQNEGHPMASTVVGRNASLLGREKSGRTTVYLPSTSEDQSTHLFRF